METYSNGYWKHTTHKANQRREEEMFQGRSLPSLSREGTYGNELPKSPTELSATKHEPIDHRTTDNQETKEDLQSQIKSTSVPILSTIRTSKNKSSSKKCETPDPFEPPKLSLLVTTSLVIQSKDRILIDTGAVLDYMGSEFCRKHGIETETTEHIARMANKSTQPLTVSKEPIEIQMKGYTDRRRLAVCPLDYDIILGKKWTREKDCVISCAANTITFTQRNRNHTIEAREPSIVHSVSASSIIRDERKQFPVYAVLVRNNPESGETDKSESIDPRIKKVLESCKDVLPEKHPQGLPPKRNYEFHIKLKEDATPQKKGIYRMSNKEMEEMKKNNTELTE